MSEFIKVEDLAPKIIDALEIKAKDVLNKVGLAHKKVMDSHTPVKTGKLKKANKKTVKKDENGDLSLELGNTDFRAHWFFAGTEKMPKRDFLTPAVEGIEKDVNDGLVDALNAIKN